MRVLMLSTTVPAVPGDGTPEFVLTLARALADEHEITVLAPRVRDAVDHDGPVEIIRFPYFPARWENLAEEAIMPGLRRQPWRIIEAAALFFRFIWMTVKIARRDRPDLIHAHWLVPGGVAATCAAAVTGVRFVVTVHGADAYALGGRLFDRVRSSVIRRSSRVVAVSADIAARLGLDDADVVPMGVDFERVRALIGQRSPRAGHLLFVGRLAEKKGVQVALEALTLLPDHTLDIVGDGPERGALESLARTSRLGDRVSFLGRLAQDGVFASMRSASVILIPSIVAADGDMDGTPVVLAEAVAAGVPVVASRLGGLEEHVTDEVGRLVEPGSPDQIAEAVLSVEAGGAPRLPDDTADHKLSVRSTARAYDAIYSAIVSS